MGDIAILGSPDDQIFPDQYLEYDEFTEGAPALRISRPHARGRGWMLGLDNQWSDCIALLSRSDGLSVTEARAGIHGGMSGSPIMNDNGAVIGVVASSGSSTDEVHTEGVQVCLIADLPGWAIVKLRAVKELQ